MGRGASCWGHPNTGGCTVLRWLFQKQGSENDHLPRTLHPPPSCVSHGNPSGQGQDRQHRLWPVDLRLLLPCALSGSSHPSGKSQGSSSGWEPQEEGEPRQGQL